MGREEQALEALLSDALGAPASPLQESWANARSHSSCGWLRGWEGSPSGPRVDLGQEPRPGEAPMSGFPHLHLTQVLEKVPMPYQKLGVGVGYTWNSEHGV